MRQLLQGMESREKVDCLLAMTKIEAGPKVEAIYYHLVGGAAQNRAAFAFSVKQSKLSEALTTLNEQATHCERYHELKVHQPDTNEQRNARIVAIMTEWKRGCTYTDCDECTAAAVTAIENLFAGVTA
tara:strand:- start:250 stop:633 length:384 start_codon:yes stop_codon:yes gene_type:complete